MSTLPSEIRKECPMVGTIWQHKNRYTTYIVVNIANLDSTKDEYPVTIVYQGVDNKKIWSKPLLNWFGSMTEIYITLSEE